MYKGVYSNSNGNIEGTKTSFRDETLIQLISSIRELASSFCSNSEEVRKEVMRRRLNQEVNQRQANQGSKLINKRERSQNCIDKQ